MLQRLAYLSAHEVGHTIGLMHNWAATTFGWGSVMDYLAPNIQLKDGKLDLWDAYPKDVGSYDRLVIQWGYSTDNDPRALDKIVRDGYAKGIFYPTDGDPRWAEYDWGADPVQWLATTQAVRRVLLERFGPSQLKPGEWVYDLEQRFSLAYLYHRFGIQAAQQFVGGQFQANAVAGDGQKPVEWVPGKKQREALELLVAAIEPENLDIPDRILAALAAPPSGTRRSSRAVSLGSRRRLLLPDGGARAGRPRRRAARGPAEGRADDARFGQGRPHPRCAARAPGRRDLGGGAGEERAAGGAAPGRAAHGPRFPDGPRRAAGVFARSPGGRDGEAHEPAFGSAGQEIGRRRDGGSRPSGRARSDGVPRQAGDAQGSARARDTLLRVARSARP